MSSFTKGLTCLVCSKPRDNQTVRYCSIKCQREHGYQQTVERWLRGEISGRRGKTATASWIKKYLIRTRGHRCESCGNTEWLGQVIPLELEHIDGNFLNNLIENLKLLCLNCHGLTPTYRSKNRKGRPRAKYYRGL